MADADVRPVMLFVAVVLLARCASFETDGETVVYKSKNRHTVLVRFKSDPERARATITCRQFGDSITRTITTPDNIRLSVAAECRATFEKDGYNAAEIEFDVARLAHRSAPNPNPSCSDPGISCQRYEGIGEMIFDSFVYGVSGLIARAADPVRNGRGKVNVKLEPSGERASRPQ